VNCIYEKRREYWVHATHKCLINHPILMEFICSHRDKENYNKRWSNYSCGRENRTDCTLHLIPYEICNI
jgi:hypothetical protein